MGQEQLRSAPEPLAAASSPSSPSRSASDVEAPDPRELRPSRSARTGRADLKDKEAKRRPTGEKADRKPTTRPSPTETSTPAPSPEQEAESTPEPEPTVGTRAAAPTTKAPFGGGILGGTNTARANAGLPALDVSSCLGRMAQRHAERLAAAGTLYHQELEAVISSCGMSTAGENVAMNYTRPSDMVGQWLDSPGHRANILNRGFTLIGLGVAQARDGAWYGVQVFGAG